MKILAKSTLQPEQIAARRSLPADGIELLLYDHDLEDYARTRDTLLALAQEFPVVGLEAPSALYGQPVNPVAEDNEIRNNSRTFLHRCVGLANAIASSSKAESYVQYQYSFSPLTIAGKPFQQVNRSEELEKIAGYHHALQRGSDVPIQVENGTPFHVIEDGINKHFYYRFTTIRLEDFAEYDIPVALDITHLAISLYTWMKAEPTSQGWHRVRRECPRKWQLILAFILNKQPENKRW